MDTIGIGEFIGGLIGAAAAGSFITLVGTYVLERLRWTREDQRWQREDKLRFTAQRQQAYTRFLAVTYLDRWTQKTRESEEQGRLLHDWAHAFSDVWILASPPVRSAAEELRKVNLRDLADASDEFNAARDTFVAAVQKEIGVTVSAPIPADQRK